MTHACDAIVISCIDFRFQRYIRNWLEQNLKDKTFDYVGFAGASKDLSTIMNQIDISVRLHSIKEVFLIHHEDCGAYGSESSLEKHTQDLKRAKREISDRHSDLEINLFYLHLNGEFEKIA